MIETLSVTTVFWPVALNLFIKSAVILTVLLGTSSALRFLSPNLRFGLWRLVIVVLLVLPFFSVYNAFTIDISKPNANQIKTPVLNHLVDFKTTGQQSESSTIAINEASQKETEIQSNQSVHWIEMMIHIWFLGFIILLIRNFSGLISLHKFKNQQAHYTDYRFEKLIRNLSEQIGLNRSVKLVFTRQKTVPLTFSCLKPVIVLPFHYSTAKTEDITAILLHELIHIKRNDYLSNIAIQLVQAIYWLNPLVWLINKQWKLSCELSCDALVLRNGINSIGYANQLLAVAKNFVQQPTAVARLSSPIIGDSSIKSRLEHILNPAQKTESPLAKQLKILICVCFVAPLLAINFDTDVYGNYTVDQLLTFSKSDDLDLRRQATLALGSYNVFSAQTELMRLLDDPDKSVRENALYALSLQENNASFYKIEELLKTQEDEKVTIAGIHALKQINCLPAFALISNYTVTENEVVQLNAESALNKYDPDKLRKWIVSNTYNKDMNNWILSYMRIIKARGTTSLFIDHLSSSQAEQKAELRTRFEQALKQNNFRLFAEFLSR